MNRSTVSMWAGGCLVSAVLLASTPAPVVGYPYYSDGSFEIEKMPSVTPLFSGPVWLPFGQNYAPVLSDIALVTLPGSTGRVGVSRLSGDMALVGGFVNVNFGVGVLDIDDTMDFGGNLPDLLVFSKWMRLDMRSYTTSFDDSQPNGGVFPRKGTRFVGGDFTLNLGADLNDDGDNEELEISEIAFRIGEILDMQQDDTSLFHDYVQKVRFSGSIQPDFGPIILSGQSTIRQQIVFPGDQVVPEPSSRLLIAAGLAGLGAVGWRRSPRHP